MSIIKEYLEISAELKRLEEVQKRIKSNIFALMDEKQSDDLELDGHFATRKLIVTERCDSKKVQALLGDQYKQVVTETESIRLTVK